MGFFRKAFVALHRTQVTSQGRVSRSASFFLHRWHFGPQSA